MKILTSKYRIILIIGLFILVVSIFFELSPKKLVNFSDLISATLAFSSLATALFLSCFSIIPAFPNSSFMSAMKELGTDKKFLERLLFSTILYFSSSMISFILLFFSSTDSSIFSVLITSLWLSTISIAFANTIYILFLLVKIFKNSYY